MKKAITKDGYEIPFNLKFDSHPVGNYELHYRLVGSMFNPSKGSDDTYTFIDATVPFTVIQVEDFYFEHGNGD
jgi:hypothetical protein